MHIKDIQIDEPIYLASSNILHAHSGHSLASLLSPYQHDTTNRRYIN